MIVVAGIVSALAAIVAEKVSADPPSTKCPIVLRSLQIVNGVVVVVRLLLGQECRSSVVVVNYPVLVVSEMSMQVVV